MARAHPVPLIRQRVLDPMIGLLDDVGAPVGHLLHRAGLSPSVEDRCEGFATGRATFGFIELAAASQDIPDFCWRSVSQCPFHRLGGWAQPVGQEGTLRGALRRFSTLMMREISFIHFGLDSGESHAQFWRRRPPEARSWRGDVQGEQFMLAWMIQVVRLAAGSSWVPHRIELEGDDATWLRSAPGLAACQIELGTGETAITVPYELLDRVLRRPASADEGEDRFAEAVLPADTLAGSLQQVVAPLLSLRPASLELAAELAETSPRTLERRLAEEGTCWRQVLDRTRFEACTRMLRSGDLSLAKIAGELGYSDQAHLTRAFRRWTGEGPSADRRRVT
jgi:AraC-like DNA-binding protein